MDYVRCAGSGGEPPGDGICKEPTPEAECQIRATPDKQAFGDQALGFRAPAVIELGGVQSLSQAYPQHNPLESPGFTVQLHASGGRRAPVANAGRPGQRALEIPPPSPVQMRVRAGAGAVPVKPAPVAKVVAARLAPVRDLVPRQAGRAEELVGQ